MTYKQIEQARETRLWVGQIIVPTVTTVLTLLAIPGVKESLSAKAQEIKNEIKKKTKHEKAKTVKFKEMP